MLDENLMKTFLTTPQFLNACQRVEEEEQAGELLEPIARNSSRILRSRVMCSQPYLKTGN